MFKTKQTNKTTINIIIFRLLSFKYKLRILILSHYLSIQMQEHFNANGITKNIQTLNCDLTNLCNYYCKIWIVFNIIIRECEHVLICVLLKVNVSTCS